MHVTLLVPCIFRMLCAVDLDDQPRLETHEIQDIAIQWDLPLEFETFKLAATQRLPKHILGFGGIAPHRLGKLPMPI